MPWTDALNDPQAQAVAHAKGPLLVFAGAGSGKTRVITYRIANLVAEHRVAPYRILAVTFTNKAAGEMRERLARLVGEEIARELWVGTFHATCARLLRRHGEAVGVPSNFVIYDSQDQRTLVTRAIRELKLDDKRYPPRQLLAAIQKEKQEARGPDDMRGTGVGYMDDVIERVFRRYEAQLQAAGAVDFDDLIGKTRKVLLQDDDVSQRLKRRFDYVLVDEFQDTNLLQYELVRLLAGTRNLCVVGDDDQSIYRWRGADRRNILGFRRDYPDATVVKLEQNYRSTANVVKAALAVIEPSADREPKSLWTDNEPGAALEVVAVRDEHEEAAFVIQTLLALREDGQDLRDTAVFYRVHAQSRVLEESLRAARIPYQIVGGMKFFERAEIKDALSYLRVMVNDRSDVDLLRIINVPARGIGQTTIERLSSFATSHGISAYEALGRVGGATDDASLEPRGPASEISGSPLKKLRVVRDLLASLKKACADKSPTESLIHILEATGYLRLLQEDGSVEATARLENLRELVGSIRDYEVEVVSAGEPPTLDGFLERVTLRTDGDDVKDGGAVTLMTVHAAKGLEFRNVLIVGMEEDMFPYRSLQGTRPDDIEEERRLAYVAITRARETLALVHTRSRQIFGTTRWGRPSRFLSDIPPDVMVQRATPGASTESMRYIDRPPRSAPGSGAFGDDDWMHPQSVRSSLKPHGRPMGERDGGGGAGRAGEVGGRYVDREFFSDDSSVAEAEPASLRRGARVKHERFGEGIVREVLQSADPAVVAFFPSWGEKKVLLRYLRPA